MNIPNYLHFSLENRASDFISDFIDGINITVNGYDISRSNFRKESTASSRMHIISDFEMIFIKEGSFFLDIFNDTIILEKGDFVIIPPYEPFCVYFNEDSDTTCINYWIHFDVTPFYMQYDLIDLLSLRKNCLMPEKVTDELFSFLAYGLSYYQSKKNGNVCVLDSITKILLAYAVSNIDLSGRDFGYDYAGRNVVDRAIKYIGDNMSSKLKVSDICAALYISESFLRKCFRKTVGLSPVAIINVLKTKHAEQLLGTTDTSISKISEQCGFESYFYFSKVFKSIYGISPSEYRKTLDIPF